MTAALVFVWQIGARQVCAEGRHGTHIRSDIREGIQWLAAHPSVRTLALTILSFNITWGAAWSVLRVIAQRWGVVAPFWFAFAGSGLTLLAVWRQLGQIAHV